MVEGWHGVAYGRPVAGMREYVGIIRKIIERTEPLTHAGEHYQIPYRGPDASGLGKPLKSIIHGNPALKIYVAAITPGGLRNGISGANYLDWAKQAQSFEAMAARTGSKA